MLRPIDSCQNKISANQYHVTTSRVQMLSSTRSRVFKLIADQVNVFQFITGSTEELRFQACLILNLFNSTSIVRTRIVRAFTSSAFYDCFVVLSLCFSCHVLLVGFCTSAALTSFYVFVLKIRSCILRPQLKARLHQSAVHSGLRAVQLKGSEAYKISILHGFVLNSDKTAARSMRSLRSKNCLQQATITRILG